MTLEIQNRKEISGPILASNATFFGISEAMWKTRITEHRIAEVTGYLCFFPSILNCPLLRQGNKTGWFNRLKFPLQQAFTQTVKKLNG